MADERMASDGAGGVYAVAAYVPVGARRAACERRYAGPDGERGEMRRDDAGRCPLGVACAAAGLSVLSRTPTPRMFANAVVPGGEAGAWERAFEAASWFICDWDAGRIADLRAALGVGDGE